MPSIFKEKCKDVVCYRNFSEKEINVQYGESFKLLGTLSKVQIKQFFGTLIIMLVV